MTTPRCLCTAAAAALAGLLTLAACGGGAHLGDRTGRAYHGAFATQASSAEAPLPPLTAAEARRILQIHIGVVGSGQLGAQSAGQAFGQTFGATNAGVSTPSVGSGLWQGASGGIQLQAK